jgi:hypothetical protein
MTIIWFTYKENPEIIDEVQKAGHECLIATSEIVIRHLAAQYSNHLILIGHDILAGRAQRIQQNYPTLLLKETATAKDVLTEIGMIMARQKPPN